MLMNCVVGEDSWESLGLQEDPNQSILKEISPECSLEGLMLKSELQYFGHLMQRTDSFEKTLMLAKIDGRRNRGWQRMGWLGGIANSIDMILSKLWKLVTDREAYHAAVHGVWKSGKWLRDWTEVISRQTNQIRSDQISRSVVSDSLRQTNSFPLFTQQFSHSIPGSPA